MVGPQILTTFSWLGIGYINHHIHFKNQNTKPQETFKYSLNMTEPSPYFLSYRNNEPEEHQRLNSQHYVIQDAILGRHLIQASVKFSRPCISIADIACGTGIWLDDVLKSLQGSETLVLVGFDVNSHGFDTSLAPAIKLVQHDCKEAFPAEYIGQFDLVNLRGLAFAVPQDGFVRLLSNAVHLLRTFDPIFAHF